MQEGVQTVTDRPTDLLAPQRVKERPLVHGGAPPDVHDDGVGRKERQLCTADEALGLLVCFECMDMDRDGRFREWHSCVSTTTSTWEWMRVRVSGHSHERSKRVIW